MSPMLCEAYRHLNQQHSLWTPDEAQFRFVMHEHQATNHHFDFSLRIGDLYITWAIRDGLTLNPAVQLMAVETGPHSLSSEKAERYIPAGQKGSGPKMVWDCGAYRPEDLDFRAVLNALQLGLLHFELRGHKLKGGWTLQREYEDRWGFRKTTDEFASDEDLMLKDRSPLSGKRLIDFDITVVASVEIKNFYASQHRSDKPVVILSEGRVLDCNQLATERKVLERMTERAARNILPDGEFVPWNAGDYRTQQHEWLDVCGRFTDVIEPSHQHTASLDLSLHPDAPSISLELSQSLTATQTTVNIGIAKAKWVSKLATDPTNWSTVLMDPAAFISSLSVFELSPVPVEIQEKLVFLGYTTIGQVANIPFAVLLEQFGEFAFTIQQAARGSYCEPVLAKYPEDSMVDRFVFAGAVESSEVIREACVNWSQRLGRKLQRKSLAGTKLWLALESDAGEIKILTRTFSKPILCPRSMLASLLLTLDGQIDQPLVSIRLHLKDLKQVSLYQPSLFEATKQERRINPALNHVRTVFGDQSVELGSQKEEQRRVKVLRMWKHATGWQ